MKKIIFLCVILVFNGCYAQKEEIDIEYIISEVIEYNITLNEDILGDLISPRNANSCEYSVYRILEESTKENIIITNTSTNSINDLDTISVNCFVYDSLFIIAVYNDSELDILSKGSLNLNNCFSCNRKENINNLTAKETKNVVIVPTIRYFNLVKKRKKYKVFYSTVAPITLVDKVNRPIRNYDTTHPSYIIDTTKTDVVESLKIGFQRRFKVFHGESIDKNNLDKLFNGTFEIHMK